MPDRDALISNSPPVWLQEPDIAARAGRRFSDPKAGAFGNFTGQWLSLRAIDATLAGSTLYPKGRRRIKTTR